MPCRGIQAGGRPHLLIAGPRHVGERPISVHAEAIMYRPGAAPVQIGYKPQHPTLPNVDQHHPTFPQATGVSTAKALVDVLAAALHQQARPVPGWPAVIVSAPPLSCTYTVWQVGSRRPFADVLRTVCGQPEINQSVPCGLCCQGRSSLECFNGPRAVVYTRVPRGGDASVVTETQGHVPDCG